MADPKVVYSESEVEVLKQARLLREIVGTAGWQEFCKILEAQIKVREEMLLAPAAILASKWPEFKDLDHAGRLAHLESIKGALIGIKLCRDLPQITIDDARAIQDEHRDQGE